MLQPVLLIAQLLALLATQLALATGAVTTLVALLVSLCLIGSASFHGYSLHRRPARREHLAMKDDAAHP